LWEVTLYKADPSGRAWVCGRSLAGVPCSIPAWFIDYFCCE